MKRLFVASTMLISLALLGCESRWGSAGLGAVGGAAAGAGGYEYKANQELDELEEARRKGRISEEEYRIRKDQIEDMSILK